jgi:exosortase K
MKKNLFVNLLIVILIVSGIIFTKIYADNSKTDGLLIFLKPVSVIVGLITQENFTFITDKGYVNDNGLIIINNSCSGINYFLIALCLSLAAAFPVRSKIINKIFMIILFILFCYLLSITANSSRIIISIIIERFRNIIDYHQSRSWLHYIEGIITFFTFLLLYYLFLIRWIKWNSKIYN